MVDKTLVSQDNVLTILLQMINDLKLKITNKDISLPYTSKLNKSLYLKIDGNGDMFLNNGGQYIKIGSIDRDKLDIEKIYSIFSITTQQERWDTNVRRSTPFTSVFFGCVQYNKKIYCIGGYYNYNTYNYNYIYDIVSDTWASGVNMPIQNYSFGCVQYNGKIYCIGGGKASNTIYIYDVQSNTWGTIANIPVSLYDFDCITYDGKIYCVKVGTNKLYIYNIGSNSWSTTSTASPNIKSYYKCVQYNSKIYYIGGAGSKSVWIYDILSDTWSTGANIPTILSEFGCIEYNGKIYCIGGTNGPSTQNSIYIYNISSNTWNVSPNTVSKPIQDHGCVLYNDRIYCIGGSYTTDIRVYQLPSVICNIPIPQDIYLKLSKISTNGNGSKVFRNDGTYKEIVPSYQTMTDETINTFLSTI